MFIFLYCYLNVSAKQFMVIFVNKRCAKDICEEMFLFDIELLM
jgi:hypothetical protein